MDIRVSCALRRWREVHVPMFELVIFNLPWSVASWQVDTQERNVDRIVQRGRLQQIQTSLGLDLLQPPAFAYIICCPLLFVCLFCASVLQAHMLLPYSPCSLWLRLVWRHWRHCYC